MRTVCLLNDSTHGGKFRMPRIGIHIEYNLTSAFSFELFANYMLVPIIKSTPMKVGSLNKISLESCGEARFRNFSSNNMPCISGEGFQLRMINNKFIALCVRMVNDCGGMDRRLFAPAYDFSKVAIAHTGNDGPSTVLTKNGCTIRVRGLSS